MTGALIILGVTILVGLILWLTHKPDASAAQPDETPAPAAAEEGEECCGLHAVCEKKAVALSSDLYYDDEELDRFARREPDSYTPEEIDEFRDVLLTLQPSEVFAWGVSLTKRDIAMPLPLRDEWVMLCNDK